MDGRSAVTSLANDSENLSWISRRSAERRACLWSANVKREFENTSNQQNLICLQQRCYFRNRL